jgi:hypothetical protein
MKKDKGGRMQEASTLVAESRTLGPYSSDRNRNDTLASHVLTTKGQCDRLKVDGCMTLVNGGSDYPGLISYYHGWDDVD